MAQRTGELLRVANLIIWDENPNDPPACLRRCRPNLAGSAISFTGGNRPFGGIPVIFGRDFQQILPVIPLAGRQEIVEATIQNSVVWPALFIAQVNEQRIGFPFPINPIAVPRSLGLRHDHYKSQGQSLAHVGIDLRSAVFSHGQLYVAHSVQ